MKKLTKKTKRILSIFITLCLVVPVVVIIAKASARYPEEFFAEGGWNEESRELAWMSYNFTDYDALASYLSDESYANYQYDTWYGAGSNELADMMISALNNLPKPSGSYQAQYMSYHGFNPKSFIPMMMAITVRSGVCESGEIGQPGCRVVNFPQLNYTYSFNEEGMTDQEINEARIRMLYYLVVSKCNEYDKKWFNSSYVNLNYCSIPMMRVIDSFWNSDALSKNIWCKDGKTKKYKGVAYSNTQFEKMISKLNISDIDTMYFNTDNLKKDFPEGYKVMCWASGGSTYAAFALCPAKTAVSTHNIIDTGSFFNFDTEKDEKEETQEETSEETPEENPEENPEETPEETQEDTLE